MIEAVYCGCCESHVFAVHADGETLTATAQRARTVALEHGYHELPARSGRARPRLVCAKCVAEVLDLAAAQSPTV